MKQWNAVYKWRDLFKSLIFGLALSQLCAVQAVAAQQIMTVASWLPPGHPQNAVVLPTWKRWIEEATQGRVSLKVEYGLSAPPAIFDLVEDGVADAGWMFHGFIPGRFVLTRVVEQPGLGAEPEAASIAYWRVYQKYLSQAGEHEGLHLAALFTHGPGQIQLLEPIESLHDLAGLKIRTGGGIQTALGERMSVTRVPSPGNKVYEFMHERIVDGVFLPMSEQKFQRLHEVARHVVALPGGMYLGSFGIVISPDFLASLSAQDREAVISVSGEKLSAMAGRAWAEGDRAGYAVAREQGVNIIEVPADSFMAKEFQRMAEGLDKRWVNEASERGVDAQQALTELRSIARSL
ncbi:MAG: TRAP transporter substrate-binding protein [Marinobacterium sp.]|nr:TRAP transporter substrate-binding protein [Marinobacterium sp.]